MGTTTGGLPFPDPTAQLFTLDLDIKALAEALDPPWVALVLNAGFVPRVGFAVPAYRVVAGEVRLRGQITKSGGNYANGDGPLTLPAGARPPATVWAQGMVARAAGTVAALAARLDITAGGVLTIQIDTTAPGPSLSIEGARFSL